MMKIAIIGSGTMGQGIAQVLCISSNVDSIVIIPRTREKGDVVFSKCKSYLEKMGAKGKITPEKIATSLSKLEISCEYTSVKGSNIVIEAVVEKYEEKEIVLKKVAPFIEKDTIVGTNTSSLSITGLSTNLPYPENVVGLHFFNPAPVMELVEIVTGFLTKKKLAEELVEFVKELGKSPVVVNEAPGFIVNRMLIPMINEAIAILAEGVATAEDIDKAMCLGAHHPMGPLKLSDLIGNDVVLSIIETLYKETEDSKYRAHPLLRKMVRANYLGRKTGEGFFRYK